MSPGFDEATPADFIEVDRDLNLHPVDGVAEKIKILSERLSDGEALQARAEAAKSVGKFNASSELADLAECVVQ